MVQRQMSALLSCRPGDMTNFLILFAVALSTPLKYGYFLAYFPGIPRNQIVEDWTMLKKVTSVASLNLSVAHKSFIERVGLLNHLNLELRSCFTLQLLQPASLPAGLYSRLPHRFSRYALVCLLSHVVGRQLPHDLHRTQRMSVFILCCAIYIVFIHAECSVFEGTFLTKARPFQALYTDLQKGLAALHQPSNNSSRLLAREIQHANQFVWLWTHASRLVASMSHCQSHSEFRVPKTEFWRLFLLFWGGVYPAAYTQHSSLMFLVLSESLSQVNTIL